MMISSVIYLCLTFIRLLISMLWDPDVYSTSVRASCNHVWPQMRDDDGRPIQAV